MNIIYFMKIKNSKFVISKNKYTFLFTKNYQNII